MVTDPDLVSIQEVRTKIDQAYSAWQKYRSFTQSQVDSIVEAAAAAVRDNSQRLAELAVQETGYGNAADKHSKNMLAADLLPRRMRGMRTIGTLSDDHDSGIVEIAEPVGVVAAVLPTTNPTSTAIYKTLIALKSGNAIVLSPHPRARACSCETAALLATAAQRAGAPENLVGCIGTSTIEATNELMRHRRTAVILSTGGSGIVRAAYSSGKPAFGVGPGNVPILVDVSADLDRAASKIIEGKSFDFGTICSSEQTVVAEKSIRDKLIAAFKSRKAHFADAAQTAALEKLLITKNFAINPDCVGQSPQAIARMAARHLPANAVAGFQIDPAAPIIAVEISGIGREHPLSAEKLSPVLSFYFVDNFAAALDACEAVLRFGGLGHTCGIYASDDSRIREYARRMPAYRVIANSPTPKGSTGITTNVFPAMTLGCGAIAGNSTSDNISPLHLINIKRLAYDREGVRAESMADPVDRSEIVAAVERYLSRRGIPVANTSPECTGVSQPLCANTPNEARQDGARSSPPPQPPPSTPPPSTVDFVCEHDVRAALANSRKIFITAKSIVTPSARDLASQHDILVMVAPKL